MFRLKTTDPGQSFVPGFTKLLTEFSATLKHHKHQCDTESPQLCLAARAAAQRQ